MKTGICYVVGAGDFHPKGLAPQEGDYLIAADGGYDSLCQLGIQADLVVGDFDSAKKRPDHPNLVALPCEKDDTDMLAALRMGVELGYTTFRIFGGTGGRMDHTIANIQCLHWLAHRCCRGYLQGENWVATVVQDGQELSFTETHTGYLSVFCQGGCAKGVTLEGLKYNLEQATLYPHRPMGVSNEFVGTESRISVEEGALLVLWYQ